MEKAKKPAAFLKDIDRIIFDMDGVITSEQNYWNAAALTIDEVLNSNKHFGSQDIKADLSVQEIREMRDAIFVDDKLISLLKDRGVNTNWDLAFVVLGISLIIRLARSSVLGVRSKGFADLKISAFQSPLPSIHFHDVYQYLGESPVQGYEIYTFIAQKLSQLTGREEQYFARQGELWNLCQQVFQEWYLGDEMYLETYGEKPRQVGKNGLVYYEQPIIPLDDLKAIIVTLHSAGIHLGVGTGRPFFEIDQPLTSWEIKRYFDEQSYITYREVAEAEQRLEGEYTGMSLAKPHPYVFLKAIYGKEYPDSALLEANYDKKLIERTLVVGDAGSDIMAAKAINCKFAAVLTGVSGARAREYFEKMKADYILDSIRDLVVHS